MRMHVNGVVKEACALGRWSHWPYRAMRVCALVYRRGEGGVVWQLLCLCSGSDLEKTGI